MENKARYNAITSAMGAPKFAFLSTRNGQQKE
jgi:hypothetical protein